MDKENKKIGLMSVIDEKSLTPETKTFVETLDEKLASLVDAYVDDSQAVKSLIEKAKEMSESIDEKLKGKVSDDDVKALKKEFNEKLLRIKASTEKGGYGTESPKTVSDLISEKAEDFKSMVSDPTVRVVIDVKAAGTITTTGNIDPQPNPYLPAPTVLPGVNPIVHPRSRILDYVRTVSITSPAVVLVNETAGEGDFQWTAEGALKPLLDFGFETQDARAKKIAARAKMSQEMLSDIPFIQSETNRIMTGKYERKLAASAYSGDGTGDSILGIKYFAPAYTQTCLNGKIENPALSEVLFAAATQIRNLGFEGSMIAFINPCDWAAEMMRKDDTGVLLEMNKLLEGITVVPTGDVASGNFLIGDLSVYTLYVYETYSMSFGYENDDFTKNLVSLVAEGRVIGFMSDNNKGALCADLIASVQTLIAKPSI